MTKTKKRVSASINENVDIEARKVATRRGISYSQFIEKALINEMNRKSENGVKAELVNLKKIIEDRIAQLEVIEENTPVIVDDINSHITDISDINNLLGFVSVGVLDRHSKELNISTEELIKTIYSKGIELNITD